MQVDPGFVRVVDGADHLPIDMGANPEAADIAVGAVAKLYRSHKRHPGEVSEELTEIDGVGRARQACVGGSDPHRGPWHPEIGGGQHLYPLQTAQRLPGLTARLLRACGMNAYRDDY